MRVSPICERFMVVYLIVILERDLVAEVNVLLQLSGLKKRVTSDAELIRVILQHIRIQSKVLKALIVRCCVLWMLQVSSSMFVAVFEAIFQRELHGIRRVPKVL